MGKFLLFIFSFFYVLSANADEPNLDLTKKLCRALNTESEIILEDHFDPTLLTDENIKSFKPILDKIVNLEGGCDYVEQTSHSYPLAKPRYTTLIGKTGRQYITVILLNEKKEKISGFFYVGQIAKKSSFNVQENMVKANDGTGLKTLVFVPTSNEKNPVVVERTPYFNFYGDLSFVSRAIAATYYLDREYAFVTQAIRGTSDSEGEVRLFNPQEIDDGASLVNWIHQQNWSNGKAAAVGTSYDGLTALALAASNVDGLDVVIAGAGPTSADTGTFFMNGPMLTETVSYIHYLVTGEAQPFSSMDPYTKREDQTAPKLFRESFEDLDIRNYDSILYDKDLPEWNRWAEAYTDIDHPLWKERGFIESLKDVQIPVIQMAGTRHDGNMPDTVDNHRALQSSPLRDQHRLILGHWDHHNNTPSAGGANMASFIAERFDSWLAYYLKDKPTPFMNEPLIRLQSHKSEDFLALDQLSEDLGREWKLKLEPRSFNYNPLKKESSFVDYEFKIDEDKFLNGMFRINAKIQIDTPQTDIHWRLYKKTADGQMSQISMCVQGQRLIGPGINSTSELGCFVYQHFKAGETLVLFAIAQEYGEEKGLPELTLVRNTNNSPENFWDTPQTAKIDILSTEEDPAYLILHLEE